MKDLNAITFKAFIVALSLLEDELPEQQKAKLNQIGQEAKLSDDALGKLHNLAKSYQQLYDIYQQIRTLMTDANVERNKCDLPIINEAREAKATEITNIVKTIEQQDGDNLKDLLPILEDANPVKAAKKRIKNLK